MAPGTASKPPGTSPTRSDPSAAPRPLRLPWGQSPVPLGALPAALPSPSPGAAKRATPSGPSSSNNSELKLDCLFFFFFIFFVSNFFYPLIFLLYMASPCPVDSAGAVLLSVPAAEARPNTKRTPEAPLAQVDERGNRRTLSDHSWCLLMTYPNMPAPSSVLSSFPHTLSELQRGLMSFQFKNIITEPSLWSLLLSFERMMALPWQKNVICSSM